MFYSLINKLFELNVVCNFNIILITLITKHIIIKYFYEIFKCICNKYVSDFNNKLSKMFFINCNLINIQIKFSYLFISSVNIFTWVN